MARSERRDWSTLISAVGAIGGVIALVYAIGGVVLGFRYAGLGLSAQALGVTAREQLLVRGGVAMVLWATLGLILVACLEPVRRRVLKDDHEPRAGWTSARRMTRLAAAAIALPMVLTLNVWWPLVALATIVATIETMRLRGAARLVVCAVAVGAVAAAYEADRLRYIVERTAVEYADPPGSVRGILIGQTDRGIYVVRINRRDSSSQLVFVPADRVQKARIAKAPVNVIESERRARRAPIRKRLIDWLDLR